MIKIKKFWNKINNEIFIYGDIVGEKFFENEVTAKEFADDLKTIKGPLTIHINSNGGDCFTALAISNLIKNHKNLVTISIDGICASAATLISCAGHKVEMAENALMMIHLPSVFLYDFYDAIQLAKIESSLNKVRDSILATYAARTGLNVKDLFAMLSEETWLTAQEAKELNFVDEVTGAVETEIDDAEKLFIINSVALKKNYYPKAKEKLKMTKANLLDKIKNLLKGDKVPEKISPLVAQERERIENLQKLKTENAAVNAILDVAISEGASVEEVQKYVDAVNNVEISDSIADKIVALIEDNLKSGAEGVGGSVEKNPAEDAKAQADLIAKFANAN